MMDKTGPTVKRSLRGVVLGLTVIMLSVLAVLSVFSAFLGSKKAAVFFNTPLLAFFWIAVTVLFVSGFFTVRSLRRNPGLLLCHLGCLLVMLGSLWGSETAHKLRARFFGGAKVRQGVMQIYEGEMDDRILSGEVKGLVLASLPFKVALDDFYIEYYESEGSLQVGSADGRSAVIRAAEGERISLGSDLPEVAVVRVFENFRIQMQGGERKVWDEKGQGINPALEVEITSPGGSKATRYVFDHALGEQGFSYDGLKLDYACGGSRAVRDYKSELAIVEDEEVVLRKTIEVNKPLHYGGYSFYQSSYDQQHGRYTVLSVVSSSGLALVFPGYAMLCLGAAWRCWFKNAGTPRREVSS